MKLVSFGAAGEQRLGFLRGDDVVDPLRMSGDPAMFGSALAFIRAGDKALKAAQVMVANPLKSALIARERVTLAAPLTPSTMLCSGSNYHDHNAEKANTPISGKEPEFFVKTADCVVGPDEPILYDERLSKKIDCEVELAIVIGKAGRHIPVASALDHVVRLHHRQRRHGARPPGAAHAGRHDLVRARQRQGVRLQRAARAVHRDRRRDRRSATARAQVARQR